MGRWVDKKIEMWMDARMDGWLGKENRLHRLIHEEK